MKKFMLLALVALSFTACEKDIHYNSMPESGNGYQPILYGKIYDDWTGNPIDGFDVEIKVPNTEIWWQEYDIIDTVRTDEDGIFQVNNQEKNIYAFPFDPNYHYHDLPETIGGESWFPMIKDQTEVQEIIMTPNANVFFNLIDVNPNDTPATHIQVTVGYTGPIMFPNFSSRQINVRSADQETTALVEITKNGTVESYIKDISLIRNGTLDFYIEY